VEIKLHGVPPYISGANLQSEYIFEQMHFHWGAEHTVDGLRGPLELHLVHYDKQYANVSVAAQHENGIVVVSVLFEVEIIFVTLRSFISCSSISIIFCNTTLIVILRYRGADVIIHI